MLGRPKLLRRRAAARQTPRLRRQDRDAGELWGQLVEVFRVTGDDHRVREGRRGYHDGIDRQFGVYVPHSPERNARSLGRFERRYHLTRREDLLARITPPAPPLRDHGQRDEESRATELHEAQETACPLLAALGRNQRARIEDVLRDHAVLRPLPRFFQAATSAAISASILTASASVGSGTPCRFR